MLIINRRTGEKLRLNTDIVVTVLSVHGNQVKIGIDAPASVIVDREEIHQRRAAGIPHPKAREA